MGETRMKTLLIVIGFILLALVSSYASVAIYKSDCEVVGNGAQMWRECEL